MQAAVLQSGGASWGRYGVSVSNNMGASDSLLTGGYGVPGLAVRRNPGQFAIGEPVLAVGQNLTRELVETILLGQQTSGRVFDEPNFGLDLVD